jgi:hypothetical protein
MAYWRMQLHPNDSHLAAKHALESLAAGFIGLDFEGDCGDLTLLPDASRLKTGEKDYLQFARDMALGDKVLIMLHHFPFALVAVSGPYNYIKTPEPEIGVWFRHFRRVDEVKYFADLVTNAASWEPITMTDTISPLKDPNSKSYKLIQGWL